MRRAHGASDKKKDGTRWVAVEYGSNQPQIGGWTARAK